MRDSYDIKSLNPRENPYTNRLKKPITINLNVDTIEFFKTKSEESGIPYQTLINLYLTDCAKNHRDLKLIWQ